MIELDIKKKKRLTKKITVALSEECYSEIKEISKKYNLKVSEFIRELISLYLKENKSKNS